MNSMKPIPKDALGSAELGTIIEGLTGAILGRMEALLKDEADLVPLATEIATITAQAAAAGDSERLERIKDLLPHLAEIHRIRASKAIWDTLNDVIQFAGQLVNSVLAGVLVGPAAGGAIFRRPAS